LALEGHENASGNGSVTKSFRLPKTVVPSNYKLELTPDLEKFSFAGSSLVDVNVLEETSEVKINSKELDILKASAKNAAGTNLEGTVTLDEETEIATITFKQALTKGNWQLSFEFNGTLNDKLKGFYRSIWTDDAGAKHTIATTQFESTDARRAFPCFDEPEFKATFDVALTVPEKLTALSNGAITESKSLGNGLKRVAYERTMKMSTYLVCFCVGEFVSSKPEMVNGIEVRIWTVPGKENLTGFAMKAALFATNFYEKYFEIAYPGGKKIDHIAIPDFASGAMENLGLITYRETALLVNEATATHAELNRVAVVVLHELAHMWFGDLVTMGWWNGLWLNESFATFMENLSLSVWKPEWHIWDEFGLSRAAASRVDALKSTHPIECAVNHPDEAAELFDVISYEKGCSVLYQIHEFMGGETFRQGIAAYLKKHSYGNTETHDLWDALEGACKANTAAGQTPIAVRKIMDSWVFTAGHPVLEVSSVDAGSITVKQKAFKFLQENSTTLWPVPVSIKASVDGKVIEKKFLLESESHVEKLGSKYDWVIVNAGGSGFYRVTYDKALTGLLTKDLNLLSTIERFNLINDAWACVRSGILSTPDYLQLISLFGKEEDPNVWSIITSSLGHLHSLVKNEHREKLAKTIHALVKPMADKLGYDAKANESVQTKQLRGSLIGTLGTIGADAAVKTKAEELFTNWKNDKQSVDSNVVPALVSILAYHGDKARYDEFFKLSQEAKTPQEVQRFLFALGRFRDAALLQDVIAKCITDDVRSQDAPYLFASILGNEIASTSAWKFLQENWKTMVTRYPENGVVRMMGSVASLDTAELEKEVIAFFKANPVKSGEMATAQALEQLRINVAMRERETAGLKQYLLPAVAATK
jgi:puromycin-sensitive aminopeptidase